MEQQLEIVPDDWTRMLAIVALATASLSAVAQAPEERSPWLVIPVFQSNPKLGTSVGALAVTGNHKLESLAGLGNLRSARRVTIDRSPTLSDLQGLERLHSVESLVVTRTGISSVRGLEGLRSARELLLLGNPRLISLGGLKELQAAESVRVMDNRRLSAWLGFLPAPA